jgi:hypothetical protein
MTNIIKEIRKILGNFDSSQIHIHIANEEIWIEIYEIQVPITVDLKKKEVYVNCEIFGYGLTASMLDELSKICRLLKDNLDRIEELLKWD